MKSLRFIGKEIVGLFVDDEFLAMTVLILVSAVIILVKVFDLLPLAAGILLLIGCVSVLLISGLRTTAARRASVASRHETWKGTV
jgi:hypothetical protein